MNEGTVTQKISNSPVTLRITALWAFSEAFLGGILHGIKIPFAGLFLAFIASVCITIIAAGTRKKGEIIKATLLVIIIKFILSPHTPPMAYVAVMMQGLAGELFFIGRRTIKLSAFFLTLFSLVYSAFQHLLVLTILFGNSWWKATDIFLNKITQTFLPGTHQYSLYIIIIYLSCYLIAGILGGIMNIRIVQKVNAGEKANSILQMAEQLPAQNIFLVKKKHHKKKTVLFFMGGLMLLLLIISYLPFFNSSFSKNKVTEIILRAVIILLAWNYFITPLLRKWMQQWIEKYKERKKGSLNQVISLLPEVRSLLNISWQLSKHPKKLVHIKGFITNSILLIVNHE